MAGMPRKGKALIPVAYMLKLANYCRDAVGVVLNDNKRAIGLRRLTDIEVTLTELTDSYDALLESHKKLRSRIGMRKTREDQKTPPNGAAPNPQTDPDGYKRAMRLELRAKGILK